MFDWQICKQGLIIIIISIIKQLNHVELWKFCLFSVYKINVHFE